MNPIRLAATPRAAARCALSAIPMACALAVMPAGADTPYTVQVRAGTNDPAHGIYDNLQSALDAVRAAAPAAARIEVGPGRYVVKDTIVVDMAAQSATLDIVGDTANPPQFSGAIASFTTGWTAGAAGTVEHVLDAGIPVFRSLYVSDGVVRRRSRFPDYPLGAPILAQDGTNGFVFNPADLPVDWITADGTEIVTLAGYRSARMAAHPVVADSSGRIADNRVSFAIDGTFFPTDGLGGNYRFYAENIPDLKGPGQWRFDAAARKLVYKLRDDESLSGGQVTKANAPLSFSIPNPQFDHRPLLSVGHGPTYAMKNGKLAATVGTGSFQRGVSVTGLMFTQTDWSFTADSTNAGALADYAGAQALSATMPPQTPVPGQVVEPSTLGATVEFFCNNCSFSSSVITDTGGHGLRVNGDSNQVLSNRFARIGGNGIVVGNRWQRPTDTENPTKHTRILGNDLHQIGVRHPEGVAVIVYGSSANVIQNNAIDDVPYSGISVGFAQTGEYTLRQNVISFNRISNVMQQLDDGAAIYVAGVQTDSPEHISSILHNFIQSVAMKRWHSRAFGFYGLYFDKSSAGFSVEQNFVGPTTSGQVKLSSASNITLKDNYFVAGLTDWISKAPPAGSYLNASLPLKVFQPGPIIDVIEPSGTGTAAGSSDESINNLFVRQYDTLPAKRLVADVPPPGGKRALATSDNNFYFDRHAADPKPPFNNFYCLLGTGVASLADCPLNPQWKIDGLDAHSIGMAVDAAGASLDPRLTIVARTPVADDPSSYLPRAEDVKLDEGSPARALVPAYEYDSTGLPSNKAAARSAVRSGARLPHKATPTQR